MIHLEKTRAISSSNKNTKKTHHTRIKETAEKKLTHVLHPQNRHMATVHTRTPSKGLVHAKPTNKPEDYAGGFSSFPRPEEGKSPDSIPKLANKVFPGRREKGLS